MTKKKEYGDWESDTVISVQYEKSHNLSGFTKWQIKVLQKGGVENMNGLIR